MLLAFLLAAATPPVLLPSGNWNVEFQDNMCLMTRNYGTGEDRITLGFQNVYGQTAMDLVVLGATTNGKQFADQAAVQFNEEAAIKGQYVSVPAPTNKTVRVTRIGLGGEAFNRLATAKTLRIVAKPIDISVRLGDPKKALYVYNDCQIDLVKSWGVDPVAAASLRKPTLRGVVQAYYQSENYPAEAMEKRIEGAVTAVLQVSDKGLVTGCRIVASAGPSLNQASCQRGIRLRFNPATNTSGEPIASFYVLRIRWQLP